jgi:hypothetical protein
MGSVTQSRSALFSSDGAKVLDHATLEWTNVPWREGDTDSCLIGDDAVIFTESVRPQARLRDLHTGQEGPAILLDPDHAWDVVCGLGGGWAFPGESDRPPAQTAAAFIDTTGALETRPFPMGMESAILGHDDGSQFTVASDGGAVALYDSVSGTWTAVDRTHSYINALAVIDDDRVLVLGTLEGTDDTLLHLVTFDDL